MPSNQAWRISAAQTFYTSSADFAAGTTVLPTFVFDNTPATLTAGDYAWADFELNLPNGLGTLITAQQQVELYVVPALDGTDYQDFPTTGTPADILMPQALYRGAFMIRAEATASTAIRVALTDVLIGPYLFKIGMRNTTGVALKDGSTHMTLKMWAKAFQNLP